MKQFILSHDMTLLVILAGFIVTLLIFLVLALVSFFKDKDPETGWFFLLLDALLVFILIALYLNSIFQELPPPI